MFLKKAGRILVILTAFQFCCIACTVQAENVIDISLSQCIDRALTENLSLKAYSMGLKTDNLSITQAETIFDPAFSVEMNRSRNETPNYYAYYGVDSIEQENSNLNMTFGQKLRSGADWGVGFYNALSESNIETAKNYSSYLGIQVNQPLLKGFGKKVNTSSVYFARLDLDNTAYDIENRTVNLIYQVTNAYWDLVYAWQSMRVLELSADQADSLLAYNRKGRELGVLTDSDVLEAESTLLSREQDILNQKSVIREKEDGLRRLLNMSSGDELHADLKPTDEAVLEDYPVDIGSVYQQALGLRPDYKIGQKSLKRYQFNRDLAKNNLLPTLDLNARYNIQGSGTSYDKNIRDMGDFGQYNTGVGLTLSFPIGNRDAKLEMEKREIQIRRQELTIKDIESTILNEIRSAARNVEILRESVDVAQKNVSVNELKLKTEEERFKNKLSTSYYVLQYQTDLANSRNLYHKSIIDYTKAVNELKRAGGLLLRDHNISIVTDK